MTHALAIVILGSLLAGGPLWSGSPPSDPAAPSLAVVVASERELPPLVWRALRREFERALRPLGLRIEWWPAAEDPTGKVAQHLISAKFLGACGAEEGSEVKREGAVEQLGFTHVSEGSPIPYIEVDCDAVRGAMGGGNDGSRLARFPSLFGQALARVLAHESYHALARSKAHGRSGIAKSNFAIQDLMEQGMEFELEEIQAMRSQLGPRQTSTTTERVEAEEGESWPRGSAH